VFLLGFRRGAFRSVFFFFFFELVSSTTSETVHIMIMA